MSKKDFDSLVAEIEGKKGYERPAAFAVGLATVSRFGRVLDTYYPFTNLGDGYPAAAVLSRIAGRIAGGGSFELEPEQLNEAIRLLAAGEADGEPDLNIEALRMALAALPKDEHAFHSQRTRRAVVGFIGDLADQPADVADIYLRLHLLSQRKIQPHGCNLENIFGVLPNVVWSNRGPFDSD